MTMNAQSKSKQLDPSVIDLARLQGSWEQVHLEADGVTNPPDDHTAPGALTTITESHFMHRAVDGTVLLEGTFTLNAGTEPKSITWVDSIGPDAGKRLPASYILDGDRFVFIAADEGVPRPLVFRTRRGLTMRTFIRKR
jgi:uncharacterized protein (TIGR03067 family)